MPNELSSNNLFGYATNELSQDAFICWLLSFVMQENWDIDPQLRECAIVFINQFYPFKACDRVTSIKKQYNNMDILVEIGDIKIIIEDKTFTGTHDNQITRYKQILLGEGTPACKIICVYYKIVEQPEPEPNFDFEFTREKLLHIFFKYKDLTDNRIFKDYVEYLEWIDRDVNSFSTEPITEWANSRAYIGFFSKLIRENTLNSKWCSWGYVNNTAGGFWGLWWGVLNDNQLNGMGILKKYVDECYLQLENNQIAVKISLLPNMQYDQKVVNDLRWKIFNYFRNEIGEEFQKRTFRDGKVMTVGYILYNENNYHEKINLMQNTMKEMANGKFHFDA